MSRLLALACLAGAARLLAWGPEGHALAARIASTQLTPAAAARVAEILGPDSTLVSVASWADEVRRDRPATASWHFIDIPISQKHLNMTRDCPKEDCILAEIAVLRRKLQDPALTPVDRREALMFLVHFIGDMHEPLHCADNNDRGGNSVPLLFHDRVTNLHSIWDSGLLNLMPPENQLFQELSAKAAARQGKWRKGTVNDWAEESHKLARKTVYGKLSKLLPNGAPTPVLPAYEKEAFPRIKEQLERAGVRLAAVLNATLR